MSVPGEAANLNKLVAQLPFDAAISIQNAFQIALRQGVGIELDLFARGLGESLKNVKYGRDQFQAANWQLARMMQDSMLRSYDQTVTARKEFPSYRVGEASSNGKYKFGRFGGGKLRAALQSRDMVIATPQGIAYINNQILDDQAAQWARLNYGAGNRGGKASREFNWTFNGFTLGALSLPWAASPGFRMPHGVWVGSQRGGSSGRSGGNEGLQPGFYPRNKSLNILTQGIAPRRFFDAGLARYVREFPGVYSEVLQTFIRQGLEGKGPLPTTSVSAETLDFISRF